MKWKPFLALIMIIGIIGLMTYSDAGKSSLQNFKIGWFAKSREVHESFTIVLNSEKGAFYGQSYTVSNASFVSESICIQMKLNDMPLKKDTEWRCKVSVDNLNGEFSYTNIGIVKLIGDSNYIRVDDLVFDFPVKLELEIVPSGFTLDSISEREISLTSVKGEVKMFKNSTIETITYLEPSSLEISDFIGQIKLENGLIILEGTTTSIK